MEAKWIGSSGARTLSATFVFSSARPRQQTGRRFSICLSKSGKSKKMQAIQLDAHAVAEWVWMNGDLRMRRWSACRQILSARNYSALLS